MFVCCVSLCGFVFLLEIERLAVTGIETETDREREQDRNRDRERERDRDIDIDRESSLKG